MTDHINFKPLQLNPKDLNLDLKSELEQFLNNTGFCCCLLFSIDNNISIRLLSVKHCQKHSLDYNFSKFLNFNIQKENGIYKLLKSTNTIVQYANSNTKTYVRDVNYELYIPVKYRNDILGCIYLATNDEKVLNTDITELHQILKKHLFSIMNIKTKEVFNRILIENIILINKVFEGKSSFMSRHSYNVASWSMKIAKELNYSDEKIIEIYLAALMHDIGKIYISNDILNKKNKLTDKEYNEMKKHVDFGYTVSKDILFSYNSEIPIWILQHHEKWDGTGYPYKLKEQQITREARILKVADALDGMLSKRNYKNKKNLQETITELKNCSGKDFDPKIVESILSILNNQLHLNNKIINEPLLPGNLIFNTNHDLISLNGYITNLGEDLIFKSTNNLKPLNLENIKESTLAISKLNIIYEFKVSQKQIDTNKFLLNILSIKNSEKTFSLLWLIPGFIINPQTKKSEEIIIDKISGTTLTFSFKSNNHIPINLNDLTAIIIIFEDKTKIPLTGKISITIKINQFTHYKFEFTGIKESYRDEIFRQIFRKQISFRKFLNS